MAPQLPRASFVNGVAGIVLIGAACFLHGCNVSGDDDTISLPQPTPPPSAAPSTPTPTPVSSTPPPSAAPSTPTPTPVSWMQCDRDCTHEQHIATCRDRVDWVLEHTNTQLDEAITLVNGECDHQCMCIASDFNGPHPTHSPTPPTPFVTPPTPLTTPPPTHPPTPRATYEPTPSANHEPTPGGTPHSCDSPQPSWSSWPVVANPPSCNGAAASDPCDVREGQCGTIAGEQRCDEVHVRGHLRIENDSKLITTLLKVHTGGVLQVGSAASPAKNVNIDLGEGDESRGQLLSDGEVHIYGRAKTSWTVLAETCNRCQTIKVKHCSGWEKGDQIVLVGTGNGETTYEDANREYRTEERTIETINECEITLDRSSDQLHPVETINGRTPFTIASEVLNMGRSVHIYGTGGIRTRQQYSGFMKVHHAKVSNCGFGKVGEYCLHFHHLGNCPQCSFVGNVVTRSVNKALTVHGTSYALVEDNVLYDHRGAFLYVEDGNEIGNCIKNNALVCPEITHGATRENTRCTYDGVPEHKDSDRLDQAGLYVVSATNDFIGNHIAGMEHGLFQDFQGGTKAWGGWQPEACRKVCPRANPFGKVKGNYLHNNNGFGFYAPHTSFPTRVKTDSLGYVSDWNSCLGFNPETGEDNSAGYIVEDHVELFHNFGHGGYDGGETAFKNSVFAFGRLASYYKTFRRGVRTGPLCDGCSYYKDGEPNLPGGSCMWEYKDTVFEDVQALRINHHCGNDREWSGGMCASHYWFTGSSEWKGYPGTFKLINGDFPKVKTYSDAVVYYKGDTYFATRAAHPAFNIGDCQSNEAGGDFTRCSADNIRIVRIYSANRGMLKVINNNDQVEIDVPYTPWIEGGRAVNEYDYATEYKNGGLGYSFLVKSGQSYTLRVEPGPKPDFFTLEYSEAQMPYDCIKLSVQGGGPIEGSEKDICSDHGRNWITPYGPYTPQTGAWWEQNKWATEYTNSQYKTDQEAHLDFFLNPAWCQGR